MADVEIFSRRFKTQRGKTFFFDVKKNSNGKFVKITESIPQGNSNYRRAFMTVSEEALPEFIKTLEEIKQEMEKY
ncbi:MAG: hypothetical protein DRI36_00325 [Caldiserica bacterium]|nr:MAG: hypothetical protein DRI36_00325 [Caldisericota bacterium]